MSDKHHDEDPHAKSHGGGGGHGGAHGGGSHEEHEGAPEWLISFADNVTLMMGFFVILLAMNMSKPASVPSPATGDSAIEGEGYPPPAMLDAAIAIRSAFHNPVLPGSENPRDALLVRRLRERELEGSSSNAGPRGKRHDTQSIRDSDYRNICGVVTFGRGSSELTSDSRAVIDGVVLHARGLRFVLDIRGHVSAAEAFGVTDRGMRLSYERAERVALALVERGVPWGQLRLLACADSDRVATTAYTDAAQRANERVEILVTEHVIPEYVEPATDGEPANGGPASSQPAPHQTPS